MLSSALVKITPVATTQTFASGLFAPVNITGDSNGNLYVIDFFDDIIKVTANGVKTIFAGNSAGRGYADGQGTSAIFNLPTALTVDAAGYLYIADNGNSKVREATPTGDVTTISAIFSEDVREMAVTPNGNSLYMRSSNALDTATTPNLTYYSDGSNAGALGLSGLTYAEDIYAGSVTYNQNGYAYFSPVTPQGQGPKLYRIGTPTISVSGSAVSLPYTPINNASVNSYPGSNAGSEYTQFSNYSFAAKTIIIFSGISGPWRILNGRTISVGFCNATAQDAYPLAGTFIDLNKQLWITGLADMAVTVTGNGSNVATTLIKTSWQGGTNYFISGGNMLFSFSNDISSTLGTVVMTGLTGAFAMYNGLSYAFTNCNSVSSPFEYQTTVVLPSNSFGAQGGTPTLSVVGAPASVFPVSGVTATMSNLFSPSANVITGMEVGILKKYTLSGDVATLNYSCNVGVLYGAIGGVANVTSTLIPEVYSLIQGDDSNNGTISIIRNVY